MKHFFTLCAVCALSLSIQATDGALPGRFTVSSKGDQIVFSQGNLQYQPSHDIWRFAENQRDTMGSANVGADVSTRSWIDLFGWGTSGYNDHVPYLQSTLSADYDTNGDLNNTEYDWGYHNAILNGGDQKALWRTITLAELRYIFKNRDRADSLVFIGNIDGQCGLFLLPDDWNYKAGYQHTLLTQFGTWDGNRFNVQTNDIYDHNTLTTAQWEEMESRGAVFLPTAGIRVTEDRRVDPNSFKYWVSDYFSQYMGYVFSISYNQLCISCAQTNINGLSVRLVQEAPAIGEGIEKTAVTVKGNKFIRDGQLFIETNGKIYTAQGIEVK